MTTVIETRALRKVYPVPKSRRPWPNAQGPAEASAAAGAGIVALDGLELDVGAGEFFGLLGPNGAGKTTTIGVLTTRVRPTSGTAAVGGADVMREPSAVKRRIGVVPQRPNLDRGLTVLENLVFHAAYFGIRTRRASGAHTRCWSASTWVRARLPKWTSCRADNSSGS